MLPLKRMVVAVGGRRGVVVMGGSVVAHCRLGELQNAKQRKITRRSGAQTKYSNGCHPAASRCLRRALFGAKGVVVGVWHIIIIYIHGLGFNFYATRKSCGKNTATTMRVKLKIKRRRDFAQTLPNMKL